MLMVLDGLVPCLLVAVQRYPPCSFLVTSFNIRDADDPVKTMICSYMETLNSKLLKLQKQLSGGAVLKGAFKRKMPVLESLLK